MHMKCSIANVARVLTGWSVAQVLRGSVECSIGCCFGVFQAPTLLLIALLPASTLKWSLANVRIAVTGGGEPRLLTAMETIQVACMWRVARRTAGMEDVDPLSDPPATVSAAPAASTSHAKKIGGAEHDESGVKPSLSESHRYHWGRATTQSRSNCGTDCCNEGSCDAEG